jgi:hypothetical protein
MYAFIHIPKTGGSTFRHMLRCSFGAQHLDIKAPLRKRESHAWIDGDDLHRAQRVYPKLAGICGHRVTPFSGLEEAAPDIRYFTFVREPIARLASHFQHHQREKSGEPTREDFLRFCEDPHQRNVQSRWIGGDGSADAALAQLSGPVGFVGLTEDFETSVLLFERWLNRPELSTPYESRNVHKTPKAFDLTQDEELAAAARDANHADLVVYEEIINNIYPAQIAAYGPTLETDRENLRRANETFVDPGEPTWAKLKRNWLYKPLLHLGIT